MLFDEQVVALLREHFVCVITDAPWSKVSHRNAATWDEVESWKSAPRNSEIVYVVSADKRDRRGIVYHHYKEPAQLMAILEDLAKEDGRIEIATAERERMVVMNRLRARLTPLRRALNDALGKKARPALSELDAFAATVSDADLCPEAKIPELLAAMQAGDQETRAELAQRLDALLQKATEQKGEDDVVVRAVREARKSRPADFADVTGLVFAQALLTRRLGES